MTNDTTIKEAASLLGKKGGSSTLRKHGTEYFRNLRKKSRGRKKLPVEKKLITTA